MIISQEMMLQVMKKLNFPLQPHLTAANVNATVQEEEVLVSELRRRKQSQCCGSKMKYFSPSNLCKIKMKVSSSQQMTMRYTNLGISGLLWHKYCDGKLKIPQD